MPGGGGSSPALATSAAALLEQLIMRLGELACPRRPRLDQSVSPLPLLPTLTPTTKITRKSLKVAMAMKLLGTPPGAPGVQDHPIPIQPRDAGVSSPRKMRAPACRTGQVPSRARASVVRSVFLPRTPASWFSCCGQQARPLPPHTPFLSSPSLSPAGPHPATRDDLRQVHRNHRASEERPTCQCASLCP